MHDHPVPAQRDYAPSDHTTAQILSFVQNRSLTGGSSDRCQKDRHRKNKAFLLSEEFASGCESDQPQRIS